MSGQGSVVLVLGSPRARYWSAHTAGTVTAESDGNGRGSTFTVIAPLRQSAADSVATSVSRVLNRGVWVSVAQHAIVVVDDEADARDMATLMLRTRGAEVRTASSATDAIEMMQRQRPDVLLADIGMPGDDGYALIRRWRGLERDHAGPRVAAIAVTAYASPRNREEAAAAGFDWHIAKPIDLDELLRAIAMVTSQTCH